MVEEYVIKNTQLVVNLLNTYEVRNINGENCLCIPIKDVFEGKITTPVQEGLVINEDKGIKNNSIVPFTIPSCIAALYKGKEDLMQEDVKDYLILIADCWEYHNSSFASSILKKATRQKPRINSVVYKAYPKEVDSILTQLVTSNLNYIKGCWTNN